MLLDSDSFPAMRSSIPTPSFSELLQMQAPLQPTAATVCASLEHASLQHCPCAVSTLGLTLYLISDYQTDGDFYHALQHRVFSYQIFVFARRLQTTFPRGRIFALQGECIWRTEYRR